uniref:Uncharacterized protein n=1 Tax=mine drainage metagenome TaxID=410659 RepID=E6QHY1_9ZZZZ
MNRVELQALSEIRLREAKSLLANGLPDGAYYLAGYSAECALKACVAKRTMEHDFPDRKLVNESHTHNLIELVRVSQLAPVLKTAMQADSGLADNWIIVQNWSEASRYQRWEIWQAQRMVAAVEDGSGGLLPWIRLHW